MSRERSIIICEVAPRDGFQNEPVEIATEQKVNFINDLSRIGFSRIEVSAFVSSTAVPQMRDADEVLRRIDRVPGTSYVALVPNTRGAERAIAAKVSEVNFVTSVSEAHNFANTHMSCDRSVEALREIAKTLRATGIQLNATAATAFACPFEGYQPVDKTLALIGRFLKAGATSITIADTIGAADPGRIGVLVERFHVEFGRTPLTVHCHDTRGMALANILCAYERGVSRFDTSLGGIGGCPFAPGATGNACTEDVVHMFACMGIETRLSIDLLIAVAKELRVILGHELPSRLVKTKPSWQCQDARLI